MHVAEVGVGAEKQALRKTTNFKGACVPQQTTEQMVKENNSAAQGSRLEQIAALWGTMLQIGPRGLRYVGTAMSIAASLYCSLLYAHLLMIVYMHENNFFSYDYISKAGLASELMYLQFELIAVLLAIIVAGSLPTLTHVFFRWRRWLKSSDRTSEDPKARERSKKEKADTFFWLGFGLCLLVVNIACVSFTLLKVSTPLACMTLGFAWLVALFVTVVYCIDVRIPRWVRLIGSFAILGTVTVMFSDIAANFVEEALRRARLGGNVPITMDYAEARSVSKVALEAARKRLLDATERKPEPEKAGADTVLFNGERAFECVAPAQGYLVLDAPEHLYVRVSADLCDATDSRSRAGKAALFVQVIEKSKLRHYRLYRGSTD